MLKINGTRAPGLLLALACLVVTCLALGTPRTASAATLCPSVPAEQLTPLEQAQRLKICQETRRLEIDNDRNEGALGDLLAFGPLVTALAAIIAVGLTFFKQQRDKSREAAQDRGQPQLELQSRCDEQFATATGNLGSEAAGLQAAGASSLLRIQQRSDSELQREIVLFCAAQLRIGVGDRVRQIVMEVFEKALRASFTDTSAEPALRDLSLDGAQIPGLNLADVDLMRIPFSANRANLVGAILRGADLWGLKAFEADLRESDCAKVNFGPAVLNGAICRRSNFAGASLSSSKWRDADVSGATFMGARLQSADFRCAILQGVEFSHANLNDAFFVGAHVDTATMRTILKANNWRKAHFDPVQQSAIAALS